MFKSYLRKPWVLVAIGVLIGGTILATTVATIVKKAKGVVHPGADGAAAKAQGV